MASLNEHYRAARPSCDRSSEISVVLGKRIQGCATSKARFEPEDCTRFSRRVQQRESSATRDKKLPLSLVRCQLHISRMLHRQIKDTPCRFRCPHCSTRHKILVSAAAIVHEQIAGAPGADWNLGSRRFAQPPELKPSTSIASSIASREKLWGGDISGPTTPVTVHGP